MALLLALAEMMARHIRTLEDTTLSDALTVGIAQVGALVPGVSRSGSTLTAALFLGLKRVDAARFSFLPACPPSRSPAARNSGSSTRFTSMPTAGPCSPSVLPLDR